MPDFRRYYLPNSLYFITTTTKDRRPIFHQEKNIHLLLETIDRVQTIYPFQMLAYCILPDHIHLLLQPQDQYSVPQIMHSLKRNFTMNYKKTVGLVTTQHLWQGCFWDHLIRNEKDLIRHLDYIHHNPVKHGLVQRPEDYPYSSYGSWLKQGYYEKGWGHSAPRAMEGLELD